MPTRLERLDAQAARAREKLTETKSALAKVESERRAATQKARHHRRYALGELLEAAGLGGCDTALLQDLLTLCHHIADSATPRATLLACQELASGLCASVDGCAQAAPGVPPTVSE
jgi:hypothetical protein